MENQIVKLENISEIKSLTLNSYEENKNSVSKCLEYGGKLYEEVSSGEMNDEKDEKIKKFIDRVVLTLKTINERRKPVTQMFDTIKKAFTEMENAISAKNGDSVIYNLQKIRNDYAALKIKKEEEERERQQREQLFNLSKENLHNEAIEKYHAATNKALDENIETLNNLFAGITLENIEKSKDSISNYLESFKITNYLDAPVRPQNIDEDLYKKICNDAYLEVKDSIKEQYKSEIGSLKDDLLLKLPSKKIELEKIEEQKKTDFEAAKKAAEELAKKDADEAARKAADRKVEEDKKKQAEALAKQSSQAVSLFDPTPVTNAKVSKKIQVLDKQGFLNIIQYWWTGVGVNMSIEELSKKLDFMVTYAEREANKNFDKSIDCPQIKWIDDVKAK